MKRSWIPTCVLTCALAALPLGDTAFPADPPIVLDVWPGKAVGDHGQIGPERVRDVGEAPTADAKWVTNVTRPTLSVFRPEAGKNARTALIICPGGGYWNLAWDKEGEMDRASCQPNFAIVAYPGYILTRPGSTELADYLRIPAGTCPMFVVHASDDQEPGAQPEQSLALYGALRRAGVPVELHIYESGGHGFGVRKSDQAVSNWTLRCAEWLRHRDILPRTSEELASDAPSSLPEGINGIAVRYPGE